MKNLWKILFFAAAIGTSSCKKNNCCTIISLDQRLEVRSSAGTDLLDPKNSNSWTEKDIELFYLNNGNFEKVYNSSLDLPKNIKIIKNGSGTYELEVFVNTVSNNVGISTTLIQFGSVKPDTLEAELKHSGASVTIARAWINGVLVDGSKPYILTK